MLNLKVLRMARGYTIAELATKSGVTRANLYAYEQGKGNPTVGTLTRLATVLDVPLRAFFPVPRRPRPQPVPR